MRLDMISLAAFAIVASIAGAAGTSAEAQCRLFGRFRLRNCVPQQCCPAPAYTKVSCCDPVPATECCDPCEMACRACYGTSPMYIVQDLGFDGVYYNYATSCCDQTDLHLGLATSTYPLPVAPCDPGPLPPPPPPPTPIFGFPPSPLANHHGEFTHEYLGYHDASVASKAPVATTKLLTVVRDPQNRIYKFHIAGADTQRKWFLLFYEDHPFLGRLYFAREYCHARDSVTYAADAFNELTPPVAVIGGKNRSKKKGTTTEGPLYKAHLKSNLIDVPGGGNLDAVVQIVIHDSWVSPVCP